MPTRADALPFVHLYSHAWPRVHAAVPRAVEVRHPGLSRTSCAAGTRLCPGGLPRLLAGDRRARQRKTPTECGDHRTGALQPCDLEFRQAVLVSLLPRVAAEEGARK